MGKKTTFAIAVGTDPDDITVEATDDGFGSFQTEEEAALRLIEVADSRIYRLRASRDRAKRLLRSRGGIERAKATAIAETADTPAPPPADDGWTAWEGGECPVKDGDTVAIRLRNGFAARVTTAPDWRWNWAFPCDGGDIVAYRIVEARDG